MLKTAACLVVAEWRWCDTNGTAASWLMFCANLHELKAVEHAVGVCSVHLSLSWASVYVQCLFACMNRRLEGGNLLPGMLRQHHTLRKDGVACDD